MYEHFEIVKRQETYQGETESLIHMMISVSDNYAANSLVTRLGEGDPKAGMKAVNLFCAEDGYMETHMGRLLLDFTPLDDNYTSVKNCGRFLPGSLQVW